jgi:hypothetical protein
VRKRRGDSLPARRPQAWTRPEENDKRQETSGTHERRRELQVRRPPAVLSQTVQDLHDAPDRRRAVHAPAVQTLRVCSTRNAGARVRQTMIKRRKTERVCRPTWTIHISVWVGAIAGRDGLRHGRGSPRHSSFRMAQEFGGNSSHHSEMVLRSCHHFCCASGRCNAPPWVGGGGRGRMREPRKLLGGPAGRRAECPSRCRSLLARALGRHAQSRSAPVPNRFRRSLAKTVGDGDAALAAAFWRGRRAQRRAHTQQTVPGSSGAGGANGAPGWRRPAGGLEA